MPIALQTKPEKPAMGWEGVEPAAGEEGTISLSCAPLLTQEPVPAEQQPAPT